MQDPEQFENAWDEAALEEAWREGDGAGPEGDMNFENMMNAWKEAADKHKADKNVYNMTEGNPYLDAAAPFQIAKQKLANGEIKEAILALEAEA
jgi:hypothetical protein